MPGEGVRGVLGEEPVIANLTFGAVRYGPYECEQMDKLGVSVNQRVLDHIVFKIDQTAMLHETQLPGEYVVLEEPLSAQWNPQLHHRITTNAVELIKLLLNLHTEPWARIPTKIKDVISQSTNQNSPWPVKIHDLLHIP